MEMDNRVKRKANGCIEVGFNAFLLCQSLSLGIGR
jgi:hypothetical protein